MSIGRPTSANSGKGLAPQSDGQGTVTAVVVHFRGGEHLDRCVRACLASNRVTQVLVVDNEGVGEDLRARLAGERVEVIDMGFNSGFGRAANSGMARAGKGACLVLNQDVVLPPETLEAMLRIGEEAEAWIVAPRLHDAQGVERSRKSAFPPPLRWSPPAAGDARWRPAPYVVGAAMMFMPGHTDLRFDERFFMYGEDEDICYRTWLHGGRVIALENAWALHVGATASSTVWSERSTGYRVLAARARFVRKHSGWLGVLRWAVGYTASVMRTRSRRLWSVRPRSPQQR